MNALSSGWNRPSVIAGQRTWRLLVGTVLVLLFAVLAGCASAPKPGVGGDGASGVTGVAGSSGDGLRLPAKLDPRDPWEPFNRQVFHMNETVDRVMLKPLAEAYVKLLPTLVRRGVSNFFNNLSDFWSFLNSALQGKGANAVHNLTRFQLNTIFGLGGLLDIATEVQIPRNREDFGKTLGTWGVPMGPYVVLPVLGPSSMRDSVGLTVDLTSDLLARVPMNEYLRNGAQAVKVIDKRANLLGATQVLEGASLDPYSFTRDAYIQLRERAVKGDKADDEPLPPEEDYSQPAPTAPAAPAAQTPASGAPQTHPPASAPAQEPAQSPAPSSPRAQAPAEVVASPLA